MPVAVTMNRPVPRVVFVFATTEPQKIQQAAPPILSRTQRFEDRPRLLGAAAAELDDEIANMRAGLARGGVEIGQARVEIGALPNRIKRSTIQVGTGRARFAATARCRAAVAWPSSMTSSRPLTS